MWQRTGMLRGVHQPCHADSDQSVHRQSGTVGHSAVCACCSFHAILLIRTTVEIRCIPLPLGVLRSRSQCLRIDADVNFDRHRPISCHPVPVQASYADVDMRRHHLRHLAPRPVRHSSLRHLCWPDIGQWYPLL